MIVPLDTAQEIASKLCERADVDLVLPGEPRRELVVYSLAAVHGLSGVGWDLERARRDVSVTLPGLGQRATDAIQQLVRLIPPVRGMPVGEYLAAAFAPLARTSILLAPAAWSVSGATVLEVIAHELTHALQIEHGGFCWPLAYGAVPEARAWAEAQGYGQTLCLRHVLAGVDPEAGAQAIESSMEGYALDQPGRDLLADVLRTAVESLRGGAVLGGPCVSVLRELEARGYPCGGWA